MSFNNQFQAGARRPIAALIAAAGLFASAPALAQTAGGNAFELQATINVGGLIHFDISPIQQAQVSPQVAPFDELASLHDWSNNSAVGQVSMGLMQSTLQWVPGASQVIAGAESVAGSVEFHLVSLLGIDLLSITADQVHALSLISGTCPQALPKTGGMQTDDLGDVVSNLLFGNGFDTQTLLPVNNIDLPNLVVKILGITVPDLPLNPPPNTGIDLNALGIVGASLILNEQTMSGDGVTTRSLASTAIHLTLNVAGIVTADVMLGHAQIGIDCNG